MSQKEKGKEPPPQGKPLLRQEPADVAALDLFRGPCGEAGRLDLGRLTFIQEEKGGYSKKYRVRGAAGRVEVRAAVLGRRPEDGLPVVRVRKVYGRPRAKLF